ncbi:MAG TPA: helix-turn-helix transcriptional regulator [Micromonosporaceae bacterium]|jgi:transcriptional regulator with XRE-family HTH domain|nr:helix-turn-helix transcriptional regulator [Micromonosporaceae bacterium]
MRYERFGKVGPSIELKARLSQAYVSSLESGYRTNPSLAILQRLAKALGLPVSDLLQ